MDVIIVGVGGQGILTCSNILAKASMNAGLNVITSEVHGMAQRGGSVEVHVRIGEVYSPLIPIGSADVMIALELIEALRRVEFIGGNSLVIINTKPIIPVSVTLGIASYPKVEDVINMIRDVADEVVQIDAVRLAEVAGDIKSTNVVMLGAFVKHTDDFTIDEIEKATKDVLPEKYTLLMLEL